MTAVGSKITFTTDSNSVTSFDQIIGSANATPEDMYVLFSQVKIINIVGIYSVEEKCGGDNEFCTMKITIPKQSFSHIHAIDDIQKVYYETIKDISESESHSAFIISEFLTNIMNQSKKILIDNPEVVLTKISSTSDIDILIYDINVNVKLVVSDKYATKKETGIPAVQKYMELNDGKLPDFTDWKIINKSTIPRFTIGGTAIVGDTAPAPADTM